MLNIISNIIRKDRNWWVHIRGNWSRKKTRSSEDKTSQGCNKVTKSFSNGAGVYTSFNRDRQASAFAKSTHWRDQDYS